MAGRMITCCGDCGRYNWKKHKCFGGAIDPGDPHNSFYADCPLPLAFDSDTINELDQINRDQFARIQELEAKIKAYQDMKGEMK
jgi:hypothetical protein